MTKANFLHERPLITNAKWMPSLLVKLVVRKLPKSMHGCADGAITDGLIDPIEAAHLFID